MSQLVNLLSATPELPSPLTSPPPRRISQVFSPTHGDTVLPSGLGGTQSITLMSTKLAESAPSLTTFSLYEVILYTRAYVDWTTRAGPNTVPPPYCTGIHGDVIETVCTELQLQYQDFSLLGTPEIIRLFNTYSIHIFSIRVYFIPSKRLSGQWKTVSRTPKTILKGPLIKTLSNIPSLFLAGSGSWITSHAWSTSESKTCSRYCLPSYLSQIFEFWSRSKNITLLKFISLCFAH